MELPSNYEELREFARREVKDRIAELEERSGNLKKFLAVVDSITDWESYRQAAEATCITDYGDDDFKWIDEICDNWPYVTDPKSGYW